MSLRWKTSIIVAATTIVIVGSVFAMSQTTFMRNFREIEDRNASEMVERATSALSSHLQNLHVLNSDWAAWDDTYNFVQNPTENADYIKTNFTDSTFTNAGLNFIFVIDNSGHLAYGKGFNLDTEEIMLIPGSVQELILDEAIINHEDVSDGLTGIIRLPEGPLLISSLPITTSEGEGPIAGTFIMAQFMDSRVVSALSDTIHLSLAITPLNDINMTPDFEEARLSLSPEEPILARVLNPDSIAGYALLADIYGNPALIIRTVMPRDTYTQGMATMRYFLISLLAFSIIIGFLFNFLISKLVVSRVSRLANFVSNIGTSSDLSKRLPEEGNDELSTLGSDINSMIGALQQSLNQKHQATEALQTEKNKLQSVIDALADGLSIQDRDFNIIYQNEPSKIGAGHDCTGEKCYQAYEARDKICEGCPVEKAFKDGKSHTAERTHVMPSGEVTYWENRASPIRDAKGNITSCLEITRNITERKLADDKLRESEQKYRTIFENVNDTIIRLDKHGRLVDVNQRAEECFGYKPEEVIGKSFTKLGALSLKDLPRMIKIFAEVVRGGHPLKTLELEAKRKDGSAVTIEVNTTRIKTDGKTGGTVAIVRDITERKKADEALRRAKEQFETLWEESPFGVSMIRKDGHYQYLNPKFIEMFGYTLEDIPTGREWFNKTFPDPKLRDEVISTWQTQAKLSRRGEVRPQIHAVTCKDGSEKIIQFRPILLENGDYFVIYEDVTERKKAEQALADEATRRRILVDQSSDGIVVLDQDGKVYEANKRFADMLGYTPEEVRHISVFDWEYLFPPEQVLQMVRTVDEAGDHFETKHRRKDGSTYDVEISTNGAVVAGQKLIFCVCRDITRRKQAEEALQTEKNKLQSVIGAIEYDLTIQDKDFNVIYQNEASRISSGGDQLGKKCYWAYEGRDRICDGCPVEKAFKDGKSHTTERKRIMPSGEVTLWENTANPIRDARGNIVSCLEIGRNITERKKMEQQLQEKNEQLDAQNEELKAINEELRATEEELQNSQERLERMFESVTDGIVVTGTDGSILIVNQGAVRMHGFNTDEELLGKNSLDLVAPRDRNRVNRQMLSAQEKGATRFQECNLIKADGSEFPAELNTSALKDASGKVIGRITISRDVTSRKQMEKLFQMVTNSSQVGIYIIQDGRFMMSNPKFQSLTGYSEDELSGMNPLSLVLDEDRDKVKEKATSMLKGQLTSPYQFRVVNKGGEIRWVMETVTSITYQGRRATLGNYMDITERRQAEEREKQLEQELNLASRLASIGQLAAGVAHEINNPLTGVIGFSHLILSRDIPDDIKQDLQIIHSEAQRVARIVENLLVFAHQRKTGRESVNVNEIVTKILEIRSYEMKVNNIEVETHLNPELPPTMADTGQLQQVFLNIVLNAEYFMVKAHSKGKLIVKTEKLDGNIRVSFADNGTGIGPENLDKIFNPFFTTKEVGKGTGLGLSICHSIITQHDGRIYAESKPGKGATFFIELPVVDQPAQGEKAEKRSKETPKPQGAKILVVDDEQAILNFLGRLLTEWGHTVETINNADAALERLKTERYSLILLDIKLPGMSGIELYRHIEKTVPALTRRVMFITGDVMEVTTRDFLEKSRAAHITKPIDIETLKKMINSTLNQTQLAPVTSG